MSALTRFERMDDLFGEFFRRMGRLPALPAELPQDIRLDVTENEQAYTVKAEMPGARKEDIRVSLDGNQLTIAAEVKRETEKKEGERVLIREIDVDRNTPLRDFAGAATTHRAFARAQDARRVPALIFFDADGNRVGPPIIGLLTADFYRLYIEQGIEAGLARMRKR